MIDKVEPRKDLNDFINIYGHENIKDLLDVCTKNETIKMILDFIKPPLRFKPRNKYETIALLLAKYMEDEIQDEGVKFLLDCDKRLADKAEKMGRVKSIQHTMSLNYKHLAAKLNGSMEMRPAILECAIDIAIQNPYLINEVKMMDHFDIMILFICIHTIVPIFTLCKDCHTSYDSNKNDPKLACLDDINSDIYKNTITEQRKFIPDRFRSQITYHSSYKHLMIHVDTNTKHSYLYAYKNDVYTNLIQKFFSGKDYPSGECIICGSKTNCDRAHGHVVSVN